MREIVDWTQEQKRKMILQKRVAGNKPRRITDFKDLETEPETTRASSHVNSSNINSIPFSTIEFMIPQIFQELQTRACFKDATDYIGFLKATCFNITELLNRVLILENHDRPSVQNSCSVKLSFSFQNYLIFQTFFFFVFFFFFSFLLTGSLTVARRTSSVVSGFMF